MHQPRTRFTLISHFRHNTNTTIPMKEVVKATTASTAKFVHWLSDFEWELIRWSVWL